LEHPHARLAGQPTRLAHRGAAARYAPELNPVEGLWANLKDVELANRPTTSLAEVADAADQGIQRVWEREDLVVGFLATAALPSTHEPSTQPTKLK
jgi:hypothetical protein